MSTPRSKWLLPICGLLLAPACVGADAERDADGGSGAQELDHPSELPPAWTDGEDGGARVEVIDEDPIDEGVPGAGGASAGEQPGSPASGDEDSEDSGVSEAGSGDLDPSAGGAGGAEPEGGLCDPCETRADCSTAGGYCLRNPTTGERFCGQGCVSTSDCPDGYTCQLVGSRVRQCLPYSLSCSDGAGGTGGAGGGGGTGGTGGSDTGGTGATDPVGGTSGECSLTQPGATGNEAGGLIPVCCGPTDEEAAFIAEVYRLLNEHRAANGLRPLEYDVQLEASIQGHCRHMATHAFFAHDAPEPSVARVSDRAQLCGTRASGENIARGQRTPADVMRGWISSSGHNANMLSTRYSRVGIGYHQRYWGQLFGR